MWFKPFKEKIKIKNNNKYKELPTKHRRHTSEERKMVGKKRVKERETIS